MILSPEQKAAVEREGQDVCVVAGPGSGKTRVLTERFAWLVEQKGIDASRILAVTFTEKAAREIKQRLISRFKDNPELRKATERAWVATIDGFCTRLLREHSIAAGISPDFQILDASHADRMLRGAAERALDEIYAARPDELRFLLESLDVSTLDDRRQQDLAQALIDVYDGMRVSGSLELGKSRASSDTYATVQSLCLAILAEPATTEGAATLREWAGRFRSLPARPVTREHFDAAQLDINLTHFKKGPARDRAKEIRDVLLPRIEMEWIEGWYSDLQSLLSQALTRLESIYREVKRAEAAVDFGDLVELTVRLLEGDETLRRETAARFDYILMDELQDTNPLQWRLIDLLRSRFFGVGDVNQSIYGFRNAEPEVLEAYRRSLVERGGTIDELAENHRSHVDILRAVNRTLDNEDGIEQRTLHARREFPALRGPIVERIVAQGDHAADLEAMLVAERIRQWVDVGEYKLGDIALLVRTLVSTEPFQQAFDRFDIPFLVSGGRTFLEARETRDILNLLAALVNPLDDIPLVGVLRSPLAGLSDEEIFRMGAEGRREYFEKRWGGLRRKAGSVTADLLVSQILDECGYSATLTERAQANVDKVLGLLRRESRRRPRGLAELLSDLEAQRAMRADAEAPPPDAADAVRMMSVHAAKGLEFKVVFLSALHRGADNRVEVLLHSPEHGLGARWKHPLTRKGTSDSAHALLSNRHKLREQQESNRLLYVAMTRAEERLVLSYAEPQRAGAWVKLAAAHIPDATVSSERPSIPPRRNSSQPDLSPATGYLDPPVKIDRYDSAISATALAIFSQCPRKYYLGSYLGLDPETDGPVTGAIEFGLSVHRILAGGDGGDPAASSLAERFHASALGQRVARAQRVEREFDFAIEVDDVIVTGQIDLWFEEGEELLVIDYKTDRDTSSQATYATQLRLYAAALARYAGRSADRAYLYYLRPDEVVEVDLAGDVNVPALKKAQQSMDFPVNAAPHCVRCKFYRGACPSTYTE